MRDGLPGLLCAITFFAGTCAGLSLPAHGDWVVDAALTVAILLFTLAWLVRHAPRIAIGAAMLAVTMLGVVSAGIEVTTREWDEPIGLVDSEQELVRFEARLLEPFHSPDIAKADLLDAFQPDADKPPWSAPAELIALFSDAGRTLVHGRVTISAPTGPHDLRSGDVVSGVGWISGPSAPTNPAERDMRLAAWSSGWIGRLRVDAVPQRLVEAPALQRAWNRMRDFADHSLCTALDGWCDDATRALVVAMTTGRRLPGYASLRQTFAATGLSHFLAISGFNVAVLFLTFGVIMEWVRVPGPMRAWVLMVLATLFLLVVDVEVSVLRAGMAGLMTGASMALGRAWRANGVLAAAAIFTLVVDPRSAWNTGFQLSYLAVLALRHGSGPLEACMRLGRSTGGDVSIGWFMKCVCGIRTAFAASAAASIASTPVTLAWFGSINPWCAVASTLLGPVAAALTVVATLLVVVGQIPWLGTGLGAMLASLAWLFRLGVAWVGTWPGCSCTIEPMPWWWAVAALLATFAWWSCRSKRRWFAIGMMLVCWGACGLAATHTPGAAESAPPRIFRWTSLAIGDGSVHLIEAGGSTVLFDAGSISRTGVGSNIVVPALRACGVRRIDAVLVSHPHLDHFSALPEVLGAFPVARVLLTEPWFRDAKPGSAPGAMLDCLERHGIEPELVTHGFMLEQGPVTWRCLHPPTGFRANAVNDGSAAFVLTHDDLHERPLALLVGDAQDQAIARLLTRRDILRPWVMELPHHGGWRPLAQALCEWVQPSFVMQSTGARRFRRDRFEPCLRTAVRGATCRDGALRFSLDPSNLPPTLERWSGQAWAPIRPR